MTLSENPIVQWLKWTFMLAAPLLAQPLCSTGCGLPTANTGTPVGQSYSAPVQNNAPNQATGGGDAIQASGLTPGSIVVLAGAGTIAVCFLVLVFLTVRTYKARNGTPKPPP
jgi:hypothetical protein